MQIEVRPRIHISLVSMDANGYRKNGGIGFCINSPEATLSIQNAQDFSITDNRTVSFPSPELHDLLGVLENVKKTLKLKTAVHVTITGEMPTHMGLGSGSAVRLGSIEGLLLQNGVNLSNREIMQLSGRGGTSGIGINTYFTGGMVMDLGVENDGGPFVPSSMATTSSLPLVLFSIDMPDWEIGLCLPKTIKPKTREEEINFFQTSTPISSTQSKETLYHCIMGIYSSVKENHPKSFSLAIKKLQECEWKNKERQLYDNELVEIESKLYQLGADFVGMSSLGPSLYFMVAHSARDLIKEQMEHRDCMVTYTSCCNDGRAITFSQDDKTQN